MTVTMMADEGDGGDYDGAPDAETRHQTFSFLSSKVYMVGLHPK